MALPSDISIRKYAKLAALGAVGVAIAVFGLYALIAYGSRHTTVGDITQGIDTTEATLAWISAAVPAAAIIAAHLVYARILLRESNQRD
jgi:TRAP-type C4-dicarboxylate transport system permease small subunit